MRILIIICCCLASITSSSQNNKPDTTKTEIGTPGNPGVKPGQPLKPGETSTETAGKAKNDTPKKISSTELTTQSVLSPLVSYNFLGNKNNSLSSLTPVVNYGWTKEISKKNERTFLLGINPYVAGQVRIKDSTTFLPALMLPGIAGINIQSILVFNDKPDKHGHFLWFPLNVGLKLNSDFQDSGKNILQHNFRTGFGYKLDNYFQIGVQHVWAWHNITTNSYENFKSAFRKETTKISYLTIVLETFLGDPNKAGVNAGNNSILYLEWRCVTNKGDYSIFPNKQILTIGFRKDLNLSNIAPAAGMSHN